MRVALYIIAALFCLNSSLFALANPAFNGDRLAHVAGLQATSFTSLEAANAMGKAVRNKSGLNVSGSYSDYNSGDESGREYKGDVELHSSSLAYVHKFSNFSLGGSFSYIEQDLNFKNTDGAGGLSSSNADGYTFSAGGATELGDFTLTLVGGFGQLSTDSSLRNDDGRTNTDYDTDFYFVAATVIYNWIENDTYSLQPWLTLGYQSMRIGNFSEIKGGVGTFGQTEYDDLEDEVPYAELGVTVRYLDFDLIIPYASISVRQDLGDDAVKLNARQLTNLATEPNFPVEKKVADPVETIMNYAFGCEANVTDDIHVKAEAAYFSGGDIDGYRLGLSANYSF